MAAVTATPSTQDEVKTQTGRLRRVCSTDEDLESRHTPEYFRRPHHRTKDITWRYEGEGSKIGAVPWRRREPSPQHL